LSHNLSVEVRGRPSRVKPKAIHVQSIFTQH